MTTKYIKLSTLDLFLGFVCSLATNAHLLILWHKNIGIYLTAVIIIIMWFTPIKIIVDKVNNKVQIRMELIK